MRRSIEGRVEKLSELVGGRFHLTALMQKQAREYVRGGRAFMPNVRNMADLFNYIMDEVEEGKIELLLPQEAEQQPEEDGQEEPEEEGQEKPEEAQEEEE